MTKRFVSTSSFLVNRFVTSAMPWGLAVGVVLASIGRSNMFPAEGAMRRLQLSITFEFSNS